MTEPIDLILLAAGSSHRMGNQDKLLLQWQGQSLLRHSCRAACNALVRHVYVIVPPNSPQKTAPLKGLVCSVVENRQHHLGMASSLRCGLGALGGDCAGVVIALADMPDITSGHINSLVEKFIANNKIGIYRLASETGAPGHPVLFARQYFNGLSQITGDQGGRQVVANFADDVQSVPAPGDAALTNLDTPQDWQDWLARQS